jgi:sulfite reductase alpha subunit-like flavoprotein
MENLVDPIKCPPALKARLGKRSVRRKLNAAVKARVKELKNRRREPITTPQVLAAIRALDYPSLEDSVLPSKRRVYSLAKAKE